VRIEDASDAPGFDEDSGVLSGSFRQHYAGIAYEHGAASRFAVAVFADLAFDYIYEGVEAIVRRARGFAKSTNISAKRADLMGDSIDLAFMNFSDREQRPYALGVTRLCFRERIDFCARLRLLVHNELHRPLHLFVGQE